MPTPSGLISRAASTTHASMSAACRLRAAVSPPIPPPAINTRTARRSHGAPDAATALMAPATAAPNPGKILEEGHTMRLLVSMDSWGARLLSVLAIAPALRCSGGTVTPGEGSGGRRSTASSTGEGTSSSTGEGTSSSTGGLPPEGFPFACDDPEPIVVADQNTGYVRCAGGWIHRAEVVTCPSPLPRAKACAGPERRDGELQI